MVVYLDTSSINRISEELNKRIGLKSLKNHTYALSSCQIDEIGLNRSAEFKSQLADLVFNISDKKKLKDHIEIMASEVLFILGKIKNLSYIDPRFEFYNQIIKQIIKKRITDEMQKYLEDQMISAKKLYREEENLMRQTFKPFFGLAASLGYKKDFKTIFTEMINEGLINDFLYKTLEFEKDNLGYDFSIIKDEIYNLDLKKLNCSYIGIQGKIAYSYLSCFEQGKISKLKDSDQIDVRHLFYLNYADIFVTDDEKMLEVSNNMIEGVTSKVVTTENFLKCYF
ncbi:MAG: hypothetical protein ACYDIA_07055 [Candidatus Humimicrobiaceae bacterium]